MMVSYLTATVMVLALIGIKLHSVKGQSPCTSGFPTLTMPTGFPRSFGTTRIIPEMTILCSGTITSWTLAGRSRTSTTEMFPKLKVFRERGSGVYSFVNEIELGKCGSDAAQINANNFFTCYLSDSDRLSVQQNDIIGIFSPLEDQAAFEVYFNTTSRPVNYIYMMDVMSQVSVADRDGMANNTPQINLEITAGSDATTTMSNLPITSTGHGSSTTTNTDISVTTSHLTKSTTDNSIMPQTANIDVTENGTNSVITVPPTVTVQTTTIIVTALVATAVTILVVIVTIMVICLNYRCKTKKHHNNIILVNTVADDHESLCQGHQHESIHFNACHTINESEKQTNPDQQCHLNRAIETDNQEHDLSEANSKTEVIFRYDQAESNRSQYYVIPLAQKQAEESEARYEQVPAKNNKKLESDSSLPLDRQYTIPTGGMGMSTTTVQQQRHGRETRYDTIATYQKAAVYERAATYQKVATYERVVTYEKVPMTTHANIN